MRALKIFGAALAVLIALVLVILIVGIPGGLLADVIQNRVQQLTGYRLEIARTGISLRPSPLLHLTGVSLTDPRERDDSIALSVDEVTARLSLKDLLAGKIRIDDLAATRPVLHVPMRRQRVADRPLAGNAADKPNATANQPITISHVSITNGSLILADKRRNIENHLDKITLDLAVDSDRRLTANFNAEAAGQPLAIEARATVPDGPLAGVAIPVNFTFTAKDVLRERIAATAEVKGDGSVITIDALKGDLDGAPFSGSASVDVASKPQVAVTLDLARASIGAPSDDASATNDSSAEQRPWSAKPFDLRGLNYFDAKAHLSIATLALGPLQLAPAEIDATLSDGVLRGTLPRTGLYEGQAATGFAMDASADTPSFALRSEMRQVRALALLSNAAGINALDGQFDGTLNLQAAGGNPREVVAGLKGTAVVNVKNGELRGVNLARMIRALTSGTLTGWQDGGDHGSTDLTELSATFKLEKGQAMTEDLKLAGPLVRLSGVGTTDLNTKAINFRVEPKLVMTLQGQGGPADPIGLGVPVMVQGPWNNPRIFLDAAGILNDPDGVYAKLRQLGQGLFGLNLSGCAPANSGGNTSGQNQTDAGSAVLNQIGSMIKQLTTPQTNPNGQPSGQAGGTGCANPPAGTQSGGDGGAQQPGEGRDLNQIIKNLLGR